MQSSVFSSMMRVQCSRLLGFAALSAVGPALFAQQQSVPKPEDTELWEPVPRVVTPGANNTAPPTEVSKDIVCP
jgi:hypothetical protein